MDGSKRFKTVIGSITTLVTGVAASLTTALGVYGFWNMFSFVCFFISLSVVLLQILFSIERNREITKYNREMLENSITTNIGKLENSVTHNREVLKSLVQGHTNVHSETLFSKLHAELDGLLHSADADASRLLIICYGKSGYQGVIANVIGNRYNGKELYLDVMLCSPELPYVNSADKATIKMLIHKVASSSSRNVKVHTSLEELPPPSVRACVVYNNKDEPIWCCTQIYTYIGGSECSAHYDNFYALVGKKNDGTTLAVDIEKCIKKEFMRLAGWEENSSEFETNTFANINKTTRT